MLKRDPGCTRCKLCKTTDNVCILGVGPRKAEVMVIGEAPGRNEEREGIPFIGKAGELLRKALVANGFEPDDLFITNAVACRPPDNKTPTKAQIRSCKYWLDMQLQHVKPDFVLLLGNSALQAVTGKPGITARRGRPFESEGVLYVPALHPAAILRDMTLFQQFDDDIALLRTIVDRGEIPREESLNYTLVRNEADFQKLLDALEGVVSFDIETTCLYPWQKSIQKSVKGVDTEIPAPAKITMIGFGTASGEFSIPMHMDDSPWSEEALDELVQRIDEKLQDVYLVAHNGKFDFLWMLVHYGVRWYELMEFDTMLAHYILDENSRHGLKLLAQKYCGAPDWDIDKDKKQGNTSISQLALYHAHDLYYTRQLYFVLKKLLKKDSDSHRVLKKILMPCARMFVEIEYDGIYINVDKFDEAELFLNQELEKFEAELKQYEPQGIVDSKGRPIEFNWGSPAQLAKLLFGDPDDPDDPVPHGLALEVVERTKTGAASCSESVLNRIDHPLVGALIKYRGARQQLSFFIEGWKPFLHRVRSKGQTHHYLHPSFKLHGTVTGRLSCEHPNLQQVPRDKRIRSLITAPPGWTLVECDLSQIELRIAAELAGERNMLEAFAKNIDVHWLTAIREIERGGGMKEIVLDTARTWKQDKTIGYAKAIEILLEMGPDAAKEIRSEWGELRKKAKAINFGYLYGMWWKKFKIYARDNYGVEVTDEQAEDSRTAFFDMYADYPKWHKRQRNHAKRYGYVRSLSGRKRRLPTAMDREDTPQRKEAERQAINSPVQSFANDLNLMAAIQLRKEFGRDVVRICGTVHDAILLRVRNDYVEKVTRRLLKIMEWPELLDVFDITLRVPIEAEAKVGPWGEGVSLEKWIKEKRI